MRKKKRRGLKLLRDGAVLLDMSNTTTVFTVHIGAHMFVYSAPNLDTLIDMLVASPPVWDMPAQVAVEWDDEAGEVECAVVTVE